MLKKLVVLGLAVSSSALLYAASPVGRSYIQNEGTNFELYNKEGLIQSKITVQGGLVFKSDWGTEGQVAIQPGGNARAQISVLDPNKYAITVEISGAKGNEAFTIRPGDKKNAFVSYSKTHTPSLYPQTGPLKGLLGKTESGLALKNNLSASDISVARVAQKPQRTYYDVLEVARTATPEQIRAAYKKLLLIRHPDKGGSAAALVELKNAYDVLSNPEKRTDYDTTL